MGLPETTTTSSPSFLKALITIDASVLLFLHTIFKPILSIFLLLLLEYSADFWFSFHVSLSLFLVSSFFSFLSILFILGHLLDLDLIGLIKLTFRPTLFHLIYQNHGGLILDFILRWVKFEPGLFLFGVWVWAILTDISRVLLGRHFLSDVLVGAFVRVLEGIVACRFLRF
ncbi:hypothetical protein E1A91_D12G256300v1 [Gossypium mustelinum]|uniref:Phosphatidic acid phosphatase type 2/haloperoxidase domain-containing protein n=1 Tax=Gossypium mustelinum TaxID=34275 RepID=A0A5D2SKY3_GOSMU|nr:hypothetical protein E1A91_D12G256300v1 [Gossypium mustelinum]